MVSAQTLKSSYFRPKYLNEKTETCHIYGCISDHYITQTHMYTYTLGLLSPCNAFDLEASTHLFHTRYEVNYLNMLFINISIIWLIQWFLLNIHRKQFNK